MASADDVKKLAALARITVPDERLPKLVKEFDAILAYVGQLESLTVSATTPVLPYRNIMRKDGEPTPKGEWTEKLTAQFPEREGDYLKVKQIISND